MRQAYSESQSLPWGTEKRLKFIEFRLFWEGRINRGDLTEFFDISVPQASLDFQKYQSIVPNNMAYDKSGKFYFATSDFKPILIRPTAEGYFRYLNKVSEGDSVSLQNHIPQVEYAPFPSRRVDPYILRAIVSTIRNKTSVEIKYQSMSRPEPINRWISPHALAFDGFRWHIRAFCKIHQEFRDFLFSRIICILNEDDRDTSLPEDKKWNEFVTFIIGPNPGLERGPRKAIEYDYGMNGGKLSITTRIAIAYYLLKSLRIEKDSDRSPSEQQIVLLNHDEVFGAIEKE